MYNSNRYENFKEGPPGQQGEPGKKGRKGSPGPRGYKGENGKDGKEGDTGHTGPTGQSIQGQTGPTGPQGIQGLQGENTGLTGPTGKGVTGPTGPGGDHLIIYNDISIYTLKLMQDFNQITIHTPLSINGTSIEGINRGILHLQYSPSNKYISFLAASKEGFNISFRMNTNAPIKYLHMTSMGGTLSIPIHFTSINYITEQQVDIIFNFDSVLSLDEYIYPGALYHLHINWF